MRPLVLGVTGSLGSGKSAVLSIFADLGFPVCSADALAREVVQPGTPALGEIAAAFGPDVLLPDGSLDRPRLAGRIFADDAARRQLEAIIHPRVRAAELEFIRSHPDAPMVVVDVPLLFESGFDSLCDRTVTVIVAEATRQARLARRADALAPAEIARRLAAQLPQDEKAWRSDAVLDNDGTLDHTRAQVLALLARWGIPTHATPPSTR